jgi:hypothetical protein
MKKRIIILLIAVFCLLLTACGAGSEPAAVPDKTAEAETAAAETVSSSDETEPEATLPDGAYSAEFKTDSTMFHINEAYDNQGTLTVKDGKMTIHITLPSKNTLNLFPGTAEEAQADGAVLLQPTTDTVVYDDGTEEEVYGFDVPVPYLDDEFDCALIGKKGKWYDHKVSVQNPVPIIEDGEYTAEVSMTGGTGKASIESPAEITVENGEMTAKIVWSSTHYEYIKIGAEQYDRIDSGGNSTMLIPIGLDKDIEISALTTAMSEPHLIDYVLHFDGSTLQAK